MYVCESVCLYVYVCEDVSVVTNDRARRCVSVCVSVSVRLRNKKYPTNKSHLSQLQPVAKKLATATGATDYNILQNNGRIAHQVVDHVSSLPSPLRP